ncbi:retrotransposon protein [Senna tora]|uniref:Retrotransposon protein n=1 Tax=Senna tora TaxID=362788 RepID=A0A834TMJ9_9FABA|nr:retrotransposon protein [Senna tora]
MVELIKEGDEASPITHNHTDSPTTGWQAPSSWFVFKLNVDASLRMNERGRIGCVIRDSNGRCIAAMTKKIQGVVDVVQLEALAVYEGLCLAKSLMCTELQVEDFSFPVNSLNSYVWLKDFPSIICNALRSDIS